MVDTEAISGYSCTVQSGAGGVLDSISKMLAGRTALQQLGNLGVMKRSAARGTALTQFVYGHKGTRKFVGKA